MVSFYIRTILWVAQSIITNMNYTTYNNKYYKKYDIYYNTNFSSTSINVVNDSCTKISKYQI